MNVVKLMRIENFDNCKFYVVKRCVYDKRYY